MLKKHQAKSKSASEKKNRVLVNFILDKSGSMESVKDETIRGFNKYIETLKDEKAVEYLFSLTLFDTSFLNPHNSVPLADVKNLDNSSYVPDGCTALYDAIGRTVRNVESERPKVDKVLTVIQTDGHENSSREYSFAAVRELIQRKEKEGNWTFVFLGATMDSFDIGVNLGVQPGNAMRYDPNQSKSLYQTLAASTVKYARSADSQVRCLVSDEDLKTGVFRR